MRSSTIQVCKFQLPSNLSLVQFFTNYYEPKVVALHQNGVASIPTLPIEEALGSDPFNQ